MGSRLSCSIISAKPTYVQNQRHRQGIEKSANGQPNPRTKAPKGLLLIRLEFIPYLSLSVSVSIVYLLERNKTATKHARTRPATLLSLSCPSFQGADEIACMLML
jgi:hypothetical protein